ncbi:LysE family translocator [Noviherbaspirillum sedimenti]|uniref:LysE family translocator n=1 Tax=Noviherbaspirillum sedimenti TaxID=2320865 RepID=A0A3A3G5A7_9BURK|nr:LysE family translocator [Noviherbaspirillum sedimenti]RJG01682.1 LysE family translocator [Noviherbaspirillum sedimenti]
MEALLSMVLFAFVSSITPGPNNIMLTSSGILFGFGRTVPHMFGVTAGFGAMLLLCGTGVGGLVLAMPAIYLALKAAGSAYLLHLAWQLRRMRFCDSVHAPPRPLSFGGAAGFQFVNPKAWVMAVGGVAAFLPQTAPGGIGMLCLVFCVVNFCCISVWAGAGAALRRQLARPAWQKTCGAVMALLTVYAAFSLWM